MRTKPDKETEAPPVRCIKAAVQMMNGHGAPAFATAREKRIATVELARKLWQSEV